MAVGLTHSPTEMKARPTCKAVNLTAIFKPLSRKCGILDSSQRYRSSRPVAGIAWLLLYIYLATTDLVPTGYRGELLSSLLHVNVYVTHNLLNVLVQIANKMGFKKKSLLLVVLEVAVEILSGTILL
jgi:hypothetical protein